MATTISDRISDLETVLYWEGEIDNQRIRELLGVQPVWASKLMAELVKRVGKHATKETSRSPLRLTPRALEKSKNRALDDYLRIVKAQCAGEEVVEDARLDLSIVAPNVFVAIMQAIKKKNGLSIVYHSMNDPKGSERQIFPHAMVRAPRRWHVRAWCAKRREFRDFTLGRISSIVKIDEVAPYTRANDKEWNETVSFYVTAHPSLSPEQQAIIAAEYYPGASARRLIVRKCLAGYIIQDLRLATDINKETPPEFQLFVPDAQKLRAFFSS